MIRRPVCRFSVLAIVTILLFASEAFTQSTDEKISDRDCQRYFYLYVTLVVGSPEAQEDLALTNDQKAALGDIKPEIPATSGRPQDWQRRLAEMEEATAGILTADQMKRLRQMFLQCLRIEALFLPVVVDTLKLTPGQQESLRSIDSKQTQKLRALRGQVDLSRTEYRTKGNELRNEIMGEAINVLTPSQREAFQGLIGPAFRSSRFGLPEKKEETEP